VWVAFYTVAIALRLSLDRTTVYDFAIHVEKFSFSFVSRRSLLS